MLNELKIKYEKEIELYKEHLEIKIIKRINKIKNKEQLKNIYLLLSNNITIYNSDFNSKDYLNYAKIKISSYLFNQYSYNKEKINEIIFNKKNLIKLLEKYEIIKKSKEQLKEGTKNFESYINNNKEILSKNTDSKSNKFLKSAGVFASTILGFGIGGYIAYQKLFGKNSVKGVKFVNNVNKISNKFSS